MYKFLLILLIPFLNFSQETMQELLNKGVHSKFEIINTFDIRHFKSSDYQILISEKENIVQIGIWKINDEFQEAPLKVFKNGKKVLDGRLGAYIVHFHDVNDTFQTFSNFIEFYDDAGSGPDGWRIAFDTYYFISRLPIIEKINWRNKEQILKFGKHKKNIEFDYVWYYSGCSG